MQRRSPFFPARLRSLLTSAAWLPFMLVLTTACPAIAADVTDSGATQSIENPQAVSTLDLTAQPDDLWQRIRNGFSMPNLDSPLVAERQAWYLNRPKMLGDILSRSRRYLYYIVQELEKRGMPTELALLPMVESSFNPLAQSPARALGIWQFIPSTGKTYRLEQNWWLDERRDIIASTGAALDYLQFIYEMQGDWHLALASYNWGENAVARAVVKNRALGLPTDYQNLRMPGETRYYVPKLQALKNIIADPAAYGITIEPIPNRPYFGTVDMPSAIDISTAARLAEIPVSEFIALNPAYSRPVIPDSADSPLVLPADKVSVFLSNLERHEGEEKPLSVWHTQVLAKGERLDRIAAQHGMTLAHLKKVNGIGPRTKVKPGMKLLLPDRNAPGVTALLLASLPVTIEPAAAKVQAKKGKGKGKATPSLKKKRGAGARPGKAPARKPVVRTKQKRRS